MAVTSVDYAYHNPDLVYWNQMIPPGARLIGEASGEGPPCARYKGKGEIEKAHLCTSCLNLLLHATHTHSKTAPKATLIHRDNIGSRASPLP